MTDLTVTELVKQGYSREHSESWLAMLERGSAPALAAIPPPPVADIPPAVREADVRRWALDNGVPCNVKGRIPARVLAAYADAH